VLTNPSVRSLTDLHR